MSKEPEILGRTSSQRNCAAWQVRSTLPYFQTGTACPPYAVTRRSPSTIGFSMICESTIKPSENCLGSGQPGSAVLGSQNGEVWLVYSRCFSTDLRYLVGLPLRLFSVVLEMRPELRHFSLGGNALRDMIVTSHQPCPNRRLTRALIFAHPHASVAMFQASSQYSHLCWKGWF